MAPKRKSADEEEPAKPSAVSQRVTRSSTRRLNGRAQAESLAPARSPKKKKAKVGSKRKSKVDGSSTAENAKAEAPATKVVEGSKTIVIEHWSNAVNTNIEVCSTNLGDPVQEILTIFCTNVKCNSFKTRAIQVKTGLENGVSGINVMVNPEKPRRGCFEIRDEGGEKFISLLDMKRPFGPMKALDMDKVISDIIDKIK